MKSSFSFFGSFFLFLSMVIPAHAREEIKEHLACVDALNSGVRQKDYFKVQKFEDVSKAKGYAKALFLTPKYDDVLVIPEDTLNGEVPKGFLVVTPDGVYRIPMTQTKTVQTSENIGGGPEKTAKSEIYRMKFEVPNHKGQFLYVSYYCLFNSLGGEQKCEGSQIEVKNGVRKTAEDSFVTMTPTESLNEHSLQRLSQNISQRLARLPYRYEKDQRRLANRIQFGENPLKASKDLLNPNKILPILAKCGEGLSDGSPLKNQISNLEKYFRSGGKDELAFQKTQAVYGVGNR